MIILLFATIDKIPMQCIKNNQCNNTKLTKKKYVINIKFII